MHLPPVHVAILAFSGIRPLAAAINKPRQNVQKWARPTKEGGYGGEIMHTEWVREIYAAARARGLQLTIDDLVFGRDVSESVLRRIMEETPPQSRAAWWPPLPPEHGPAPAPPRGR